MVHMLAKHLISSLGLVLLITLVASAQVPTTGRLTGTVTDQQGGVIPKAAILAKNVQTGAEFRAIANGIGVWEMPSVPTGKYTISATAPGFRTTPIKEITVDMAAAVTVDATLQVGLADTVLVTASKHEEEVINAPATVSVISEQMIQALPSQNLADLLRAVPGMNVARTSAREFNVTSRSASGVMPSAQLALLDGRALYDGFTGYITWDALPVNLDEVKQVEVIRGPASAVWGANAMNGVVNIITKPPREMLGTSFTLGIGTFDRSGGSPDSDSGSLYYVSATHAQALNDRWSFKITGGAYTQDAFARPQGAMPNQFHTPYPAFTNQGTTLPKVNGRVDYDLPDGKQHLRLEGGCASKEGIGYGGLGPWKLDRGNIESYGKADYVRGALRITGYANISTGATMTNPLFVGPTGQPLLVWGELRNYNTEFGNSSMVQAKHMISYGGNFRHDAIDSNITTAEGKNRNSGGAFFQDEVLLSKHFRWVFGARIDKFDWLKGAVLSPRTTFMVKPAAGHTFRVSYNRAYMAPPVMYNNLKQTVMIPIDLGLIVPQLAGNYFSYALNLVGNKDLEEQSLNAYEVGYTAVLAKGRASLGAAFYVNDGKNAFASRVAGTYTSQNPPPNWPLPPFVLDLIGLPSRMTYRNLGKVRNKGIELSADARFSRYFTGFANYSWQALPESSDLDVSAVNHPPAHRFNAGFRFDYRRYLGDLSVGYVSSAYWNDVIAVQYSGPTRAYTAVNLSGGVRWGENGKYIAMAKISNLGNSAIQNHIFGDILKRQITGEFKVRF